MVWSPVSKTLPPIPLLGSAVGCRAAPNRPRMPARTAAIPNQHDVRGGPLVGWPQIRPRPFGVCDNRRGDRERPCQSKPRNVHFQQIIPHLGSTPLQKLRPAQIHAWHATLLKSGGKDRKPLSSRTVGHAHRVLHRAL